MNPKIEKKPLPLDRYEHFNIPQDYSAIQIEFFDISMEEVDNLEFQYVAQGYKIFFTEARRSKENLFNYIIVMAKLEVIF